MILKLSSFYKQLTPGYLKDRREELDLLSGVVESKDLSLVFNKFHQIAGSADGFGLFQLSKIADSIYKGAKNKDLDEIEKQFIQYKKHLNSIELQFED